jgi:phosphoribosylformylglycinamidine cyclo-ligase
MVDDAYSHAGVSIAAGQQATNLMKAAIHSTYGPEVLSQTGAFGGLYAASALKTMTAPVLVASTDGVGTKTMVAAKMGRWDTIGQDLVNHCVNDVLVQGARPLFFLDYVASSQLEPEQIATVVGGCATACREAGCALLGGETAEMPGVYQPGEIDLVGTIVGLVDRADLIDGSCIQPGDAILALPSTGLHTNGYSLARKVLSDLDWSKPHEALDGVTIGAALLAVHRCYLTEIAQLRDSGIEMRGIAHITGGGIVDNLPRILPQGLGAEFRQGTWSIPPIFALIQQRGNIPLFDMFHAFNMGLGMLIVMPAEQTTSAQDVLDDLAVVGKIQQDSKGVVIS